MARHLKTVLIALIAALAVLVAVRMLLRKPGPEGQPQQQEAPPPGPFDGLGIRFDGHYRHNAGQLRYLLRFYPEGRVVSINGAKQMENTLHKFLSRDTQGNPDMGLHNVMATVRGDSIFFTTYPRRGEISHRGRVTSDSTVRFVRHSHITGKDFDFTYVFMSDADAARLEQQPQEVGEPADAVGGQ